MNDTTTPKSPSMVYLAAIAGSLLIVLMLVMAMKHYTAPEPLGKDRTADRYKNLQELRNADAFTLDRFAWQDQSKGLVRLTIDRAMELTILDYKDAEASRARIIAEAEQAFAPPPETPSEFE